MTAEEQALALARWLDGEEGAYEGMDADVVEAVWVLSPGRAPAPRLDVDAILALIETGPLAAPASAAHAALAQWLDDPTQPPPDTTHPAILEAIYVLRPDLAPPPRVSVDDLADALPAGEEPAVGDLEVAEAAALKAFLDGGAPLPDDAAGALFALRPDLVPAPRVTAEELLDGLTAGPLAVTTTMPSSIGVAPTIPAPANRRRRWWLGAAGTAMAAATALFVAVPTLMMTSSSPLGIQADQARDPTSERRANDTGNAAALTPVASSTSSRSAAAPAAAPTSAGRGTRGPPVSAKPAQSTPARAEPAPDAEVSRAVAEHAAPSDADWADLDGMDDAVADLGEEGEADEEERAEEDAWESKDAEWLGDDDAPPPEEEPRQAPEEGKESFEFATAAPSVVGGAVTDEAGMVAQDPAAADTGVLARTANLGAVTTAEGEASQKLKKRDRADKSAGGFAPAAPPPPPPPAIIAEALVAQPRTADATTERPAPTDSPPLGGLDPSTQALVLGSWAMATDFAAVGQYASAAEALRPAITSPQDVGQYSAARAARYLLAAGDPNGAIAIAEQGLGLGTTPSGYRSDLLLAYADALDARGDVEAASAARDAAH